MSRRWRGVGQRRGSFLDVPPAQVTPAAPSYPPSFLRRRLRLVTWLVRRTRFTSVPPAQVTPASPAMAPSFLRRSLRLVAPLARRARFLGFPSDVTGWCPPQLSRRRPSALQTRRGRFLPLPPTAVVPAAPASVPTWSRARRFASLLTRRGRFLPLPPAVAAPAAPSTIPTWSRTRRPLSLSARRGRWFGPSWEPPFQPPVYVVGSAQAVGKGLRTARPVRRGQHAEPPWPQVSAQPSVWRPSITRATLRLAGRPVRRGQSFEPPWPQVAAQPDVWRPSIAHATLRLAGRPVRRGQYLEPPWPQGPQGIWLPDITRQTPRRAGAPVRRGQYLEPPWPQAAQPAASAYVPTFTRARRPFPGSGGSRDRYLWTPPRPVGVPAWLRTRSRPLPSQRARQRFHEPRWIEGPQTVWRPPFRTRPGSRTRYAPRPRRGCTFRPPWPQAELLIVNVNPLGPDLVGAIARDSDTVAGGTSHGGGLVGGVVRDTDAVPGATTRRGGMPGDIS